MNAGERRNILLFVCTGNICRSPMAEYMMRKRLGPDSGWKVMSAGVSALEGAPATPAAVTALREIGVNGGGHRSRPLDRELVDAASVIVVMTAAHRERVESLYPDAKEKTFVLRSFDPTAGAVDIDDPIGMPGAVYAECRDSIESALPGLQEFLDRLPSGSVGNR